MADLTSADLTFKEETSGRRIDYVGIYAGKVRVGVEVTIWPVGFEPMEAFYYTVDAKRTAKEAIDLSDSDFVHSFDEYLWDGDDNDYMAFFPIFRNWDTFLAHARTLLV